MEREIRDFCPEALAEQFVALEDVDLASRIAAAADFPGEDSGAGSQLGDVARILPVDRLEHFPRQVAGARHNAAGAQRSREEFLEEQQAFLEWRAVVHRWFVLTVHGGPEAGDGESGLADFNAFYDEVVAEESDAFRTFVEMMWGQHAGKDGHTSIQLHAHHA